VTTYAEILGSAYGYETAAFANGEWYQRSASSLLQGFGFVRPVFALQGTEAAIAAWNRQRDPARPFFLFLHTFEPHDPYGAANHPWPPVRYEPLNTDGRLRPDQVDAATIFRQAFLSATQAQVLHARMGPELGGVLQRYKWRGFAEHPDPGLAEDLRRAYWDGVRWVDGLLATTCRQLEASGLLENTLLVVTSDHGEAFGEHGALAHGLRLYDELLHVPLVMVGPGDFSGGSVVDEDVGLVDVLPTFLDWAGLAPLRGVAGRSALEIVHGGSWCRPVVSEERLDAVSTGDDVNAVRISARTHQWKYIVTLDLRGGEVREEAYDLLVDPEELDDLAEGTGRLPRDRMFDACLCEAVEAVRARVWDRAEAGDTEVYTTPYGASSAGGRTARPPPCNAGE
jgi:arylsulfatase A-like enzyme